MHRVPNHVFEFMLTFSFKRGAEDIEFGQGYARAKAEALAATGAHRGSKSAFKGGGAVEFVDTVKYSVSLFDSARLSRRRTRPLSPVGALTTKQQSTFSLQPHRPDSFPPPNIALPERQSTMAEPPAVGCISLSGVSHLSGNKC